MRHRNNKEASARWYFFCSNGNSCVSCELVFLRKQCSRMDKLKKPKTESEKKYYKEIQEVVTRLTRMTLIPDIMQVGK